MSQCPYVYPNGSDGGNLCCARESDHEGPHVNLYEKIWDWQQRDGRTNGCPFVVEFGGILRSESWCGREPGHEGLHCTQGQIEAGWFLRETQDESCPHNSNVILCGLCTPVIGGGVIEPETIDAFVEPSPMYGLLFCPSCHKQHIDEGDFAMRAHRTHHCVDDVAGKGCAFEWFVEPETFGVLSIKAEPPKPRVAFSAAVFVFVAAPEPRILLIEHKLLGLWLPFGGELEPGETPFQAAKRELREESGFEIPTVCFPMLSTIPNTPPGFLGYEEHPAGPKGTHMNFNFLATAQELLVPKGDGSWKNYQWCTAQQIFDLVTRKKSTKNVSQFASSVFRRANGLDTRRR